MSKKVENILYQLENATINEGFKGYDPYDLLNSDWSIEKFGSKLTFILTQIHKRNPFNLRGFLNIPKDYIPKGMGLFLKALSVRHEMSDNDYLKEIGFIYNWLKQNYSKGYSGYCWGLNFPYSPRGKFLEAKLPSIVVTSFVHDGIYHYYKLTKDEGALDLLESACEYVIKDLPRVENESQLCFSYTTDKKDRCFNANILGARMLARTYSLTGNEKFKELAQKSVNYTVDHQLDDGHWNYRIYDDGTQKKQIDFHQGFIIDSIQEYMDFTEDKKNEYIEAVQKGLNFYYNKQFTPEGQSYWRYPKKLPVDIHNQAQGIITFSRAAEYSDNYLSFAEKIADWTIEEMWDSSGYFYYRKGKLIENKINYIRWGQAWMLVALVTLLKQKNKVQNI